MCKSEWNDLYERKFHPSEEEERQNQNAKSCGNALQGQLAYTKKDWLRKWMAEQ